MKLEDGFITADTLTKRGYGMIIKNTGKVIAIITAVVALLLSFTDIKLSELGTAEITSNILVMLISSLIMFFSLEDAGERLCEDSKEYKEASEEYENIVKGIKGEDIGLLRDFCMEYSKRELTARRSSHLLRCGISLEEYERYQGGATFDRHKERLMKKASRLNAYPLTPEMLLCSCENAEKGELYDSSKFKLMKMSVKLLPTIVCTLLTVSIAISMKEGLNAGVIIESIIRLLTLPIVALRGYATGYNYAKNVSIPRIKTKARILSSFSSSKAGQ